MECNLHVKTAVISRQYLIYFQKVIKIQKHLNADTNGFANVNMCNIITFKRK